MKISALVSDLSDNPIVRAYPILKVLQRRYQIDVIGPCFGRQVFRAYEGEFNFKVVEGCQYPKFVKKLRDVYDSVNGDVLFAFKPKPTSYLIGLICSFLKRIPIVVDIEDWELAPYWIQKEKLSKWIFLRRYLLHGWKVPNDFKYLYVTEKLVSFSNAVFVCTNFLEGKYGGTKLYHGVDTEVFNPKGKNKGRLREKWGVPLDKKIVLFAGTPRPHKGLDDLIRALNSIDPNCKVKLLLVGGRIEGSIDGELYELSKKRTIYLGYQPHGLMPEILCLSDLVVLPQKDNLISRAQVPGKVFEAMAMAKPIVATAVSDLPEILEDCGVIVKPGDTEGLAHTIRYVLANPNVGRNMGKKARGKCVKLYSFEAMARVLFPVFQQFEKRYEA
ncbi:MAG: glycosyltransferase family 4 protein [Candidatus Hodarchaeota archaeon]